MAIFVGGAVGTLVALRCPHCKEVQARAKKAGGGHAQYRCRKCHRVFSREEGEASMRARQTTARRRDRK